MRSTAACRLSLVECLPGSPSGKIAADDAVDVWRDIEATLVPIMGKQGFSALYLRGIAVRSRQDPWLQSALAGTPDADAFAALHLALCSREHAEAAVAQRELVRMFHEVLTSLLGAPLVSRLLPPFEPPTP